jgi:hydroxymethylpyrimidine pyrophosphatase-like HAD family hydrolase
VIRARHGAAGLVAFVVGLSSWTAGAQDLGTFKVGVLAFGDMPNDIPMFGWAGWSRVAMANAHPSLKQLADEVTLSNDEDGVAVYLDRLFS